MLFDWLLSALSLLAVASVLGAIAALVLKRWAYAVTISRWLIMGSVLVIAVFAALSAVVLANPALFADDPSQQARVTAEVVSTALNCTAFYVLIVIVAAPLRAFAVRRLERAH